MPTQGRIFQFGTDIRSCFSTRDLGFACIDFYSALGLQRLCYHHYPPVGALDADRGIVISTHGYPEAWVREYLDNHYFSIDPIIRLAGTSTTPFLWSDCRQIGTLSQKEDWYLDRLFKANIGDGYAVPVNGPHGRRAYSGFGFGDGPVERDPGFVAVIQAATYLAHCRYCEIIEQSLGLSESLSIRELQALALVAQGQSNTEIASEMHVSANTVGTYVQRIFQKLSVHDRVTAVMRGIALGLIPWDTVRAEAAGYQI